VITQVSPNLALSHERQFPKQRLVNVVMPAAGLRVDDTQRPDSFARGPLNGKSGVETNTRAANDKWIVAEACIFESVTNNEHVPMLDRALADGELAGYLSHIRTGLSKIPLKVSTEHRYERRLRAKRTICQCRNPLKTKVTSVGSSRENIHRLLALAFIDSNRSTTLSGIHRGICEAIVHLGGQPCGPIRVVARGAVPHRSLRVVMRR